MRITSAPAMTRSMWPTSSERTCRRPRRREPSPGRAPPGRCARRLRTRLQPARPQPGADRPAREHPARPHPHRRLPAHAREHRHSPDHGAPRAAARRATYGDQQPARAQLSALLTGLPTRVRRRAACSKASPASPSATSDLLPQVRHRRRIRQNRTRTGNTEPRGTGVRIGLEHRPGTGHALFDDANRPAPATRGLHSVRGKARSSSSTHELVR